MDGTAKLITAIGSLIGSIAWPATILSLAFVFRNEIRTAINKIPSLIDRMRKMKIAGWEAELDHIAAVSSESQSGKVTSQQIEVAAKIAVEADDYTADLLTQLDRLCLEYDATRRAMPSSVTRTQAMKRILIKMRALAPALIGNIDLYKGSGSPGSRLAAVAMMQMNPNTCDITWLCARFEKEQPFIFYHAALALQNFANNALTNEEWDQLLGAAQRGLDTVRAFEGLPDSATMDVLEALIGSIRR